MATSRDARPTATAFPRSAHTTAQSVAGQRAVLRQMLDGGSLDLPLPGGAGTRDRWEALATWGAHDLVLARLAEGHVDAVAVLAEAGRDAPAGALLGVWASASQGTGLVAEADCDEWCLSGTLRFASGARLLDAALVTADSPAGRLVVLLPTSGDEVRPVPGSWQAVGMDDSDSLDVTVAGVRLGPDAVLGPAGFYAGRPGLAIGGIGVAAVWWGGARGVLDAVRTALVSRPANPHQLAHLGACVSAVRRGGTLLDAAAVAVERDPRGDHTVLALHVRHEVEQVVEEVLRRAGRITGATPLCRDAGYARRVADLTVYVRQQHAESDLERLGTLALKAQGALPATTTVEA